MRIVFMGTPRFSIPSLEALLEHRYDIPAVVTVPDKPQGRGRHLGTSAVKEFALSRGLPLMQPERLTDPEFLARVAELRADLFVVVAFRILPPELYTIPPQGAFNLHASLLPKYRGAAPINWAIINGETETGVTTFLLEERVDTGSMILQKRTLIGKDETAGELADRLALLGAEAVLETVHRIAAGSVRATVQDDAFSSAAPKIHKQECAIVWSASGSQVHDFVRGLSPEPCAWTTLRGKVIRIYRTAVAEHAAGAARSGGRPGEALVVGRELLQVRTGENGLVSVLEIQQEGKKRMGIAEFLRGFKLEPGEAFGQ